MGRIYSSYSINFQLKQMQLLTPFSGLSPRRKSRRSSGRRRSSRRKRNSRRRRKALYIKSLSKPLKVSNLKYFYSRMHSINKVFMATECFFYNLPIREIQKELQNSSLCSGKSVQEFFGKCYLFGKEIKYSKENESQVALQDISDAMDCWMEFIRIDPTDLIDDQPFNKIIFTSTVR